jgi:hypothetical protein
MAYTPPLSSAERLEIVEALKRGNLSHRAIAQQFSRSQSTISTIAKDAGITSTHKRKRTPACSGNVESTYDKQARVDFQDRFLSALDGMVTEGGLSPRDAREVAQASKVVLDARRAEDQPEPEEEEAKREDMIVWDDTFATPGESKGLGYDPNTKIGREMIEAVEKIDAGIYLWEERWAEEKAQREAERAQEKEQ